MKSSLSSTTCGKLMILLLLLFLFFFSSANCKVPLPPSTSSGNTLNHHHHPLLRYCDSFTKRNPRSLCNELQRIYQRLSEAIPPSQENGIDPRFGAEKRLVPSGPNPLHN
ncbi:CLAVATA3/ESR (CLE)-related protein 9 [Spatholobus suberectus]|nr:CLAVATA3/ESR (CLE)-related protein 9 [Spatholobus suberectus]